MMAKGCESTLAAFWWRVFRVIVAPQIYIHNQIKLLVSIHIQRHTRTLGMFRRRPAAGLPMSHQQPVECTLEEGSVPARHASRRRTRKNVAALVGKAVRAVSASVVLCGALMLVYFGHCALKREMTFDALDKRLLEIGAVCLAPVHIGQGADIPYVSFGQKSRYPRMVSPTIVSTSGKEVVSSERSTLCGEDNPPVDRLRREIVAIMFKSHPLMTNETAIVFGDESICLQHMVDMFNGKDPCEMRPYSRTKSGGNSIKKEL